MDCRNEFWRVLRSYIFFILLVMASVLRVAGELSKIPNKREAVTVSLKCFRYYHGLFIFMQSFAKSYRAVHYK